MSACALSCCCPSPQARAKELKLRAKREGAKADTAADAGAGEEALKQIEDEFFAATTTKAA